MRLYAELAQYWELLSPLGEHEEEAALIFGLLSSSADPMESLLELGSGTGAVAHFLPSHIQATLVDRSESMLTISRQRSPRHRHLCADLLTLSLPEQFDVVLMHDAVMYLQSEDELRRALTIAKAHCRPGGTLLFLPDLMREDFHSGHTLVGGSDQGDVGARLTEWHWDPDPEDDLFRVEFSLMLREKGSVRTIHESHTMSFFSRTRWTALLVELGLEPIPVDLAPGFPIGVPVLCRCP
jgi:SAM-dependent methyltransferase